MPQHSELQRVVRPQIAAAIPADARPVSLRQTGGLAENGNPRLAHPAQAGGATEPYHPRFKENAVSVGPAGSGWRGVQAKG